MSIKDKIQSDLKDAMRAQDKKTLGVLRLVSAAIKQVEVDERIEVDEMRLLIILTKLAKQRNESIHQFQAANRDDLVQQEQFELEIIQRYMPEPIEEDKLDEIIAKAMKTVNAKSLADMGKIMAILKPELQGRADMAKISSMIKSRLQS